VEIAAFKVSSSHLSEAKYECLKNYFKLLKSIRELSVFVEALGLSARCIRFWRIQSNPFFIATATNNSSSLKLESGTQEPLQRSS
jgi:hypothetical protein